MKILYLYPMPVKSSHYPLIQNVFIQLCAKYCASGYLWERDEKQCPLPSDR